MNNFDESKLNSYNGMFNKVPENVVICINESKSFGKILSKITDKICVVKECTDDWKYKYNGKYYDNCINGYFFDEDNNQINSY